MLRESKGITLIALVIMIIIILILAGVTLTVGTGALESARGSKLLTELSIVQHAVLERYSEYKVTKDPSLLVGDPIGRETAQAAVNQTGKDIQLDTALTYYKLKPSHLAKLGISQGNDTYIVNYEKGIVINQTHPKTESGDPVYIDTNS